MLTVVAKDTVWIRAFALSAFSYPDVYGKLFMVVGIKSFT